MLFFWLSIPIFHYDGAERRFAVDSAGIVTDP